MSLSRISIRPSAFPSMSLASPRLHSRAGWLHCGISSKRLPRHPTVAYLCLVRSMTASVEGGCLCGGVRYRLHDPGKQGSDCHCEDCRRASAAPYVTWCSFPSDAVELLSGELREVPHAGRLRFFASCCGTPLFMRDDASSGWIDITVASLDDPKSFPPQAAIWTEDKLPWIQLDPTRQAFPRDRDENA